MNHITRGGSWFNTSRFARIALRIMIMPDNRIYDLGLRIARSER
jgi:formylglycine-generating enzyme required for sulfatase activity